MNTIAFVPFVASMALAALSRALVTRLRPQVAAGVLAVTMAVLALSTLGALVVLACPLPARIPLVATAGRWAPGAVESRSPVPPAVSGVALALLAWMAWRTWREARGLVAEVRDAYSVVGHRRTGCEVVVIDDPAPHAHALGVGLFGAGRVIVSSGLVELLADDERAAVIAHERAHLGERHFLLAAVARLSAAVDPFLSPTEGDLRFALERAADEAAAARTSRHALAAGIAKTALAARRTIRPGTAALAVHGHAVARRIIALLDETPGRARAAWAFVAVAVIAAIALAWALHDTERFFEAARLWSHP